MDSGGIPDDWTPPDPPAVGSREWLKNTAFSFMVDAYKGLPDRSGVWRLPQIEVGGQTYDLGYFVLFRDSAGANYFRTDEIIDVPVSATTKPATSTEMTNG